MMLCIDGSDIESIFFALTEREGEELRVVHAQRFLRRLGDELRLMQEFLATYACEVDAMGVVVGPGSSGALRSTLSLVNAWAIGRGLGVCEVVREGVGGEVLGVERKEGERQGAEGGRQREVEDRWKIQKPERSFVLPVYERAVHTTPSHKDALGRRASV